ncbi:response regulator transcription factor [Babesia caballi]|uniref:Response regulator transcription factor n=1 Tax=Babesia caballi TaxID=5871 RepID=A0AAV4LRE4_BABCB|nr:response regulator transcription factor [Babesia caballi]
MTGVSEVDADTLTDLAKMLQWLAVLEGKGSMQMLHMTMLQQMLLVGMFDYDDVLTSAFDNVVNLAVLIQNIPGLHQQSSPLYTMDIKSDEQAKKCFDIFMKILKRLYDNALSLIADVNKSSGYAVGYFGFLYGSSYFTHVTDELRESFSKYGFKGITNELKTMNLFWNLLQLLIYGNWRFHGLDKLNKWHTSFVEHRKNYERHCSKPTLRDLLLHVKHVCHSYRTPFKTQMLKQLPVDMWSQKKNIESILERLPSEILSLDNCISSTASDSTWYTYALVEFELNWDYLVRAVPYFEEYIRDLSYLRQLVHTKWSNGIVSDRAVSEFFNKHGFGQKHEDINFTQLITCKDDIVQLIGQPLKHDDSDTNHKEGDLGVMVRILSFTYHERSMKSLAQPSCFKERLIWLVCLFKDSRSSLLFYNLHQSSLVDAFAKKLKKAHLNSYVDKVTTSLLMIPMRVWKVLQTVTNENIDYGYYQDAIFSSEYANEYITLFFEILLELLQEVHFILLYTAPNQGWNTLTLVPRNVNVEDSIKTNTQDRTKPKGEHHGSPKDAVATGISDVEDDISDYGLDGEDGGIWRRKKYKKGEEPVIQHGAAESQMREWFLYQGFSAKTLNPTLTGHSIYILMVPLLLGNFGLKYVYGCLWALLDTTQEKFLVPPKKFKEKLDWLTKLDSSQQHYNALNGMMERLVGMDTTDAKKAAEALHSVVYCASAARRYLLKDPDDFGNYNDVFCIYTAVDLYLTTLYDVLAGLEADRKALLSNIKTAGNSKKYLKDNTQLRGWFVNNGFRDQELYLDGELSELKKLLESEWPGNLGILREQVQYVISIMEPENIKDMVEWCYQLKVKASVILQKLKGDLKNTVSDFVGSAHSVEVAKVCDRYVESLSEMRRRIYKSFSDKSPFSNAIFHKKLYDYYRTTFFKILSSMYQHCFPTRENLFGANNTNEFKAPDEFMAEYHVLQKPMGRLILANDVVISKVTDVSPFDAEVDKTLANVFRIPERDDNTKKALEGYIAMMQGIKVIRQPDESNLALTAAVTTAVGTGAVGAGVVYFKFNALYAFFGKLLA